MENDDIANQIRVGLLPEGFFSFAPDRCDDRSDIEGLCVWIKVVVQRVVANVRIEADIDVVLFASTLFQDSENELVGRRLRLGDKVVIAVTDRDPRCKMITLDPDTAQPNPEVMRCLARDHEGKAGIYGAVVVEGTIRPHDKITLQD